MVDLSLRKRRAYKTIDDEDLKFPLIYGEGKKVGLCTCVCALNSDFMEKGRLC